VCRAGVRLSEMSASIPPQTCSNPLIRAARRILVCLRYGIGDVVMEAPVLEALRRAAPGADIVALGASPATHLLEVDPRVDRVVSADRWGLTDWHDPATCQTRTRIGRWLAGETFDLMLDVSHAILGVRMALWEYARVPILDTDRSSENYALSGGAQGSYALRAGIEKGWGMPVDALCAPRLYLSEDDRAFAHALLREKPLDTRIVVGVSTSASCALKRLPLHIHAEVLSRLTEQEPSVSVLLFEDPRGGGAEAFANLMRYPERVRIVRTPRLRRVAALLERCAAFFGNDTGLTHIAAAMNTPLIAAFGPTSPRLYLPEHANAAAVGGWQRPCHYRNTTTFGPSMCLGGWSCVQGLVNGCIAEVNAEETAERLLAIARGRFGQPEGVVV
jgi:ADP-heptose:LPS heptosyltransferase